MIRSIQRKDAKILYVIASKAKQSATAARDCFVAKLLAMTKQRMPQASFAFAFSAPLRALR